MGTANENPGALAGATGAERHSEWEHVLDTANRLNAQDRFCRAVAELPAEDRAEVLDAALRFFEAGEPSPHAITTLMEDASAWARWASPRERKAYALAAFNSLRPSDQRAFLVHVTRGARA